MLELLYRALVVVWFLCYMAAIYLALHIVVARVVRSPDSRLLWFFSVVTSPLTRPVQAFVATGTPAGRVRIIALVLYLALMIAARFALFSLGGHPLG